MIKRTLFFGNPAYLSTKNEQLVVNFPEADKPAATVPIEDIGMVVLEHPQITISNQLMARLIDRQAAVVSCDSRHMPSGLFMPLGGHSEQTERFRYQLEASLPLKKNLWQQTVGAKINNQAALLEGQGLNAARLRHMARKVTSGDTLNHEAQAAAYYWQALSPALTVGGEPFGREPAGPPPNHLLNYGYAILRAVTARALVGSGMLPGLGIFHRNKYNAFCLADDIMEPYRPFVDRLVIDMVEHEDDVEELTTDLKKALLGVPALDVTIDGKRSPLMVAMSRTTNSLYECFAGSSRKLLYPEYV